MRGSLADNVRLGADRSDTELAAGLAGGRPRHLGWSPARGPPHHDRSPRRQPLGERPLAALARVALADPALVILDEATADIDPRTEALVADALDRATIGCTVLVVAHRPATARRCDRVLALHAGRVVPRFVYNLTSPVGGCDGAHGQRPPAMSTLGG